MASNTRVVFSIVDWYQSFVYRAMRMMSTWLEDALPSCAFGGMYAVSRSCSSSKLTSEP